MFYAFKRREPQKKHLVGDSFGSDRVYLLSHNICIFNAGIFVLSTYYLCVNVFVWNLDHRSGTSTPSALFT